MLGKTILSTSFLNSPSLHQFGNKVLRCLLKNNRECIPINPKEDAIEGVKCVKDLKDLGLPEKTALSFVTPPQVTLAMVEKAAGLGYKRIWMQPGSEDAAVITRCKELHLPVIAGGPCLLVELGCGDHE